MIVVVGPSGAGKDSVIGFARASFAGRNDIHFVRRAITRAEDAGGEDHLAVTAAEFATMRAAGQFVVAWDAHGLSYGIPAAVRAHLEAGHVAIANGSRAALPLFGEAFDRLAVVHITANRDVLANRLALRGRETEAEIAGRLDRAMAQACAGANDLVIDNSGPLEIAGKRFVELVEHYLASPSGDQSTSAGR